MDSLNDVGSYEAEVHQDITQAELDKFFETKGEHEPKFSNQSEDNNDNKNIRNKNESKQSDTTNEVQSKPDQSSDPNAQEKEHERNYKAAMHEERERRKELQREAENVKQENKKLTDALSRILKAAEEQNAKSQTPRFEDDPLEALKHETDTTKKKLSEFEERERAREEQHKTHSEREKAANEFMKSYRSKAVEFSKSNPDFGDAYNYLNKNRFEELQAAGYSAEEAAQLIHQDEAALVSNAFKQDVNPAERIYKLAQLRGYKKDSNVKEQHNSNASKLTALEKGLNATKSINSSGSGMGEGRLSLEDIANLPDDEFSKFNWNDVLRMG